MSNSLIPVFSGNINQEQITLVNARELHQFLEVGRQFSDWIKDRIEQYEFIENQDYILTFHKTGERQNVKVTDYHITLDMAKEISMVERNAKGKQARQYFIECEKKVKQQEQQFAIPKTLPEALRLAADIQDKLEATKLIVDQQKETIHHKDNMIKASNEASVKAGELLIREFVKSCDIIHIGEKRFYEWMREQNIVSAKNEPYQQYVSMGYFTYKPSEETHGGKYRYTLRVTPRGKVWLATRYMKYIDTVGFDGLDSVVVPKNALVSFSNRGGIRHD